MNSVKALPVLPGQTPSAITFPFSEVSPLTLEEKLQELRKRRSLAKAGGGEERRARQHAEGKLSARERLALLFDEGTFEEVGEFVEHNCRDFGMEAQRIPGDGVITGYGLINNRLAYAFAQDFTVFGGSLSEANAPRSARSWIWR